MRYLAGSLLTPHGWVEGHVAIDAGRVVEVLPRPPPGAPVAEGVVVPAFVNAHTHVGDAVARSHALPATLAEAVQPPHGYKHRVLAATPRPALVAGMAQALREARDAGARAVVDFREGGLEGLAQLAEARAGLAMGVRAYARPAAMEPPPGEAAALLARADGLAVSSLPDTPAAPALALAARAAGKGFALHASEPAREPLDPVLDLRPELVVHLTFATPGDLARVRDAGCAVAVCPRSNARWVKRLPDVRAMLDLGLAPGLGSDNAMLGPCDPRGEALALLALDRRVAPDEALAMLCHPRLPGLRPAMAPGAPAELLVYQRAGPRPAAAVLGEAPRLLHREAGPA